MMKIPLKVKLALAAKNTLAVVTRPLNIVIIILGALLLSTIVIWSLNYQLAGYILFDAPLSLAQKIRFFSYGYESLFTSFDNLLSVSVVILAVLFGINLVMFIEATRRRTARLAATGTSGVAALLGILSSGCAACGTSLLTPLLATVGATSTSLVHTFGAVFNLLGSSLLLYSIYKLALQTPPK